MRRFAQEYLETWIKKKRRKALIIRGARQVGKSTLVRQFASSSGLNLLEINLEQHSSPAIWASMKANTIIGEVELAVEKRVTQTSLLFIDEIQACPIAIQALRYLVEERPELPVIAAGSLLEFVLGKEYFSMPVGRVSYFHLGPMSFREVLLAGRNDVLEESLCSDIKLSANSPAHTRLRELFKEYLYTGGMPEAVAVAQEEGSILAAREVHRSIVSTYRDDFGRYKTKTDPVLIEKCFNHVPLHLGEKNRYVSISRDRKAAEIKKALDALINARIVLPVFNTNCGGLPLRSGINEHIFKLYFLDVGLALYMSGVAWHELSSDNVTLINKGNIAEQFIAQHLAFREGGMEVPELFYWLREGKSTNAEVDFVTTSAGQMVPVEVKAGKVGSLRSLFQFAVKTGVTSAVRYHLSNPAVEPISTRVNAPGGMTDVELTLYSYPAYLVECVHGSSNTF